MIGAFAFGHRLGKDCYVGVQPIENMLKTAGRMPKPGQARAERASATAGHAALAAAFRLAHDLKLGPEDTWRLRAVSGLLGYEPPDGAPAPATVAGSGHVALPVLAGSAEQAKLLQPFFAPLGLAAVQAPSGAIPASPLRPDWIDPAQVRPQPGGVFAIPLVFGALDMSAIGTTTEVLPDGTVLAFGHQFFAQGDIAVPMATGYVHFIQPNLSASFKLGGSLKVHGAVVRDESSAVAGRPGGSFPTVPMTVRIRWPDGQEARTFAYRLVHHNRLLPGLVGNATSASLTSDTELPQLNTIQLESSIRFEDGRNFRVSRVVPTATSGRLMLGVLTPIAGLVENQFGRRKLSRIETTLTVEDEVRAATIVSATAQQTTARPGERLNITVRLQPYRRPIELKQIQLQLPADLPNGSYTLGIGGGQTYQQLRSTLRPHLRRVSSHAELFQALQEISAVNDTALYAVLRLRPANSLAIGRSELPRLPSSRFSLLAVESSTRTSPYVESIDMTVPTPYVVLGAATLPVQVRDEDTPVKK